MDGWINGLEERVEERRKERKEEGDCVGGNGTSGGGVGEGFWLGRGKGMLDGVVGLGEYASLRVVVRTRGERDREGGSS